MIPKVVSEQQLPPVRTDTAATGIGEPEGVGSTLKCRVASEDCCLSGKDTAVVKPMSTASVAMAANLAGI